MMFERKFKKAGVHRIFAKADEGALLVDARKSLSKI
jgi:hypothetical protein